jgi:hypothetical protein
MHFEIYPNMFQQVIAFIKGSWFPQKLLPRRICWLFYNDTSKMLGLTIKNPFICWLIRVPFACEHAFRWQVSFGPLRSAVCS